MSCMLWYDPCYAKIHQKCVYFVLVLLASIDQIWNFVLAIILTETYAFATVSAERKPASAEGAYQTGTGAEY